jgi:hypothetical protein
MNGERVDQLLDSWRRLAGELQPATTERKIEVEGGCGVVGFCCSRPVAARHIYEPSKQMHNRGNGKGGGIAALGFIPEQLGVSRGVLEDCYMIHVAFLDTGIRPQLEDKYISPNFDVAATQKLER